MSRDKKTAKIALCALMCALAITVSTLEYLIPIQALIPLPGVKLGLANIVILFLLYRYGIAEAAAVAVIRCLTVNLIFFSVTGLIFSLTGSLFSIICAIILRYTVNERLSFVGISVLCAAAHNIGQTAAACLVLTSFAPLSYLPVLLCASVVTGGLTGAILILVDKRMKKV